MMPTHKFGRLGSFAYISELLCGGQREIERNINNTNNFKVNNIV